MHKQILQNDFPIKDMVARDVREKQQMKLAFVACVVVGILLSIAVFINIMQTRKNREYNKQAIEETIKNRKIGFEIRQYLDTLVHEVRINRDVFRSFHREEDSIKRRELIEQYKRMTK